MPNSTALAIQVGTLYQPLVGLHHAQQLLNGTRPYMQVHLTQPLLGLHHAKNN